jgi:Ni/Co efflux regulator RcnB
MKSWLAVALLAIVATPGAALAAEFGVGVEFSEDEIRIISAWYRDHGSSANHGGGKHKQKGLPPGIAKNLQRGKPLPPGIAKQHLPSGLVSALPAPPRGYERIVVDGRVLLVEIATQVIHDILMDAVLR